MVAAPLADDLGGLLQAHRWLVDAAGDQGVEDVGQGHQPCRHRNGVPSQSGRVAAAVPLLMMVQGDLAGDRHEGEGALRLFTEFGVGAGQRLFHRLVDGVGSDHGVLFHDLEFRGCEAARLEQRRIGDSDLADVVQRCGLHDHAQAGTGQGFAEAGVLGQILGENLDIVLGAQDMLAGLVVAGLPQAGKGADVQVLNQQVFPQAPCHLVLQPLILVGQTVTRLLEFEVGPDPGEGDRRIDRFGDVVHGAQGQTVLLVFGTVHGGDEDHRDVVGHRVRAQALEDLVAIHLGHHHVEQDQVRGLGGGSAQGALARVGGTHSIQRHQQLTEQGQVLRRVIDDQDGLFFFHIRVLSWTNLGVHRLPSVLVRAMRDARARLPVAIVCPDGC